MAENFNPPCPECGGSGVSDRKITLVVSGLAVIIISIVSLSLFFPVITLFMGIGIVVWGNMVSAERRYKCKSCKIKFGKEEPSETAEAS